MSSGPSSNSVVSVHRSTPNATPEVTISVLGEGFIDPGYHPFTQSIWDDFDKFRTGPRTTPPVTVSATGLRLVGVPSTVTLKAVDI